MIRPFVPDNCTAFAHEPLLIRVERRFAGNQSTALTTVLRLRLGMDNVERIHVAQLILA